jgi:hypothetical protein
MGHCTTLLPNCPLSRSRKRRPWGDMPSSLGLTYNELPLRLHNAEKAGRRAASPCKEDSESGVDAFVFDELCIQMRRLFSLSLLMLPAGKKRFFLKYQESAEGCEKEKHRRVLLLFCFRYNNQFTTLEFYSTSAGTVSSNLFLFHWLLGSSPDLYCPPRPKHGGHTGTGPHRARTKGWEW